MEEEIKKKIGRPKKVDSSEVLKIMHDKIESLGNRVFDLENKLRQKDKITVQEIPKPIEVTSVAEAERFPEAWRKIIDETLNSDFKAEVMYRQDACFEISILVPSKYSNESLGRQEMNGGDHRHIVIANALGITGIEEYVKKIAINLGADTMRRIEEDRAKVFIHA